MTNTFTNPKPATWSAIAQRVVEREHSYSSDEPAQPGSQHNTIEEAQEARFWKRTLIVVAFVSGLFLAAWANTATDALAGKANTPSSVSHHVMSPGGRGTALEFEY